MATGTTQTIYGLTAGSRDVGSANWTSQEWRQIRIDTVPAPAAVAEKAPGKIAAFVNNAKDKIAAGANAAKGKITAAGKKAASHVSRNRAAYIAGGLGAAAGAGAATIAARAKKKAKDES